jgi:hypothetical protein
MSFSRAIQFVEYFLDPDEKHILSRDCGNITRKLIVPQMVWIKQMSTHLNDIFVVHFPSNTVGDKESIPFSRIKDMNKKLRSFDFS